MPALNVLSNLFTTIYNNESRRKRECIAVPASKFASEVLRVMQKHRYIGEFEQIDDGRARQVQNSAVSQDKQVRHDYAAIFS